MAYPRKNCNKYNKTDFRNNIKSRPIGIEEIKKAATKELALPFSKEKGGGED